MKTRLLHILMTLIWSVGIYAQATFRDSLEMQMEKASGADKFYLLSDLAWEYCFEDIGRSLAYSRQEVALAGSLDNDTIWAITYNDFGRSLYNAAKYDSSILMYHTAVDYCDKINDTLGMAGVYSKMGVAYQMLGVYDSAIHYSYQALGVYEARGDSQQISICNNNIAALFFTQENYLKSLELHFANLDYRIRAKDSLGTYYSLNGIANAYSNIGEYDSSITYYMRALKYAEKRGDHKELAVIDHNIGALYLGKHQLDEAKPYLDEALRIRTDLNDKAGLVSTYTSLGKYFFEKKKYDRSIEVLRKAEKLTYESNSLYDRELVFKYLAENFHESGQHDLAYSYQDKYIEIRDSIRREGVYKQVAEAEAKYQTEKKEKALLQVKKEKAEAELKISERNVQLLIVLGGTLVLTLVGVFLFYRSKQQQKNRLSKVRIEEQQKGLKAVIEAQEKEQKRIAKDLHDGIVQQLSGLKLGLQRKPEPETEEDHKLTKILDDSIQELRELSHRMMPKSLSELGLIPALKDMLENSLQLTDISFDFEYFGITERLPEHVEITLYRIAQELVQNVIKHSQASEVHIQLFKVAGDVMLMVEDNGKGMLQYSGHSGIGLMNISSRLDTVNGKVNIEPGPEKGTLVTIKIPVS